MTQSCHIFSCIGPVRRSIKLLRFEKIKKKSGEMWLRKISRDNQAVRVIINNWGERKKDLAGGEKRECIVAFFSSSLSKQVCARVLSIARFYSEYIILRERKTKFSSCVFDEQRDASSGRDAFWHFTKFISRERV